MTNPRIEEIKEKILKLAREERPGGRYGYWAEQLIEKKPTERSGVFCWGDNLEVDVFARTREMQEDYDRYFMNSKVNPLLQERSEILIEELKTENQVHQQALQTSQTWHERQKAEIIAEWKVKVFQLKAKLTNLLNTRKQKITQELQLIREVLNE